MVKYDTECRKVVILCTKDNSRSKELKKGDNVEWKPTTQCHKCTTATCEDCKPHTITVILRNLGYVKHQIDPTIFDDIEYD